MKKAEVVIGQVYDVKVSGSMCRVRITAENPRGGWIGINIRTGFTVRIKSAQRLRYKSIVDAGAIARRGNERAERDEQIKCEEGERQISDLQQAINEIDDSVC